MRRLANIYLMGNKSLLASSIAVMIVKEADGRTSIAFAGGVGTFITGGRYGVDFGNGEAWMIEAVVIPDPSLPTGLELVSCADARRITTPSTNP
jgi:hypothetical protein